MISDFFCNEATVISRAESTKYEDWISKKVYSDCSFQIVCRVSHLNYKDLQLINGIDDVETRVQKLYTYPTVNIKPTDIILYNGQKYTVHSVYKPQNRAKTHHTKYFIKMVE